MTDTEATPTLSGLLFSDDTPRAGLASAWLELLARRTATTAVAKDPPTDERMIIGWTLSEEMHGFSRRSQVIRSARDLALSPVANMPQTQVAPPIGGN